MKNKASIFFKQLTSLLGSLSKAKSMALKGKTNATKARLIILGLIKNKKVLFPAISHKIHALLGHDKAGHGDAAGDDHDPNKAIVIYNPCVELSTVDDHACGYGISCDDDNDDDRYPDLTHSLFDELEFDDGSQSVIDLVRNQRENAADFSLEEEIDHVADLFIRRFHRQIKMQKLESFKRYQEMLYRSV
ncbi:hypothetical protein ACLOJK_039036 [Asimina triloba]